MISKDLSIPKLNDSQQAIISGSTPQKYIKTRPGRGGKSFDYVEVGYVIKTLNEAFGFASWEFKIIDKQVGNSAIWVQGALTIHFSPSFSITKENFGGSDIKMTGGNAVDIGDDLKAAASDCLKKCASMFSIAADVYFPQLDRDNDTPQGETKEPAWIEEAASTSNICSTCKIANLPDKVVSFSKQRYGRVLCYNCQQLV